MVLLIAFLAALVLGFVAGAVLGKTVINEVKAGEKRVRDDVARAVLQVVNFAEEGRSKLEKDTKDSFDTVSKDVESIVKRLENIEHAALSKVASIMAPDAPRA